MRAFWRRVPSGGSGPAATFNSQLSTEGEGIKIKIMSKIKKGKKWVTGLGRRAREGREF
jgi:hypothetical protein